MSVIQKGGGGDEESPQVALEKAKSAQQSTAVSRTKLSNRVFSEAAKTNETRGDIMNIHAAKEAEARGNEDPRSLGFEGDIIAPKDGSYQPLDSLEGDDDEDDEGGGDKGKSGSSGGGPSPDLDLSTSEYVSFADSGSGEVVSKKDQKAEAKKVEADKAEVDAPDEGPKELKVTKADGTTITTAAPAVSGTGAGKTGGAAPVAAPAAAAKSGAPAAPGKAGGGKSGGGGTSGPTTGPS